MFIFAIPDGHQIKEVDFQWLSDNPVQNGSDLSLPEFSVTNTSLKNCTETFTTGTHTYYMIQNLL